MTTKTTNLEYVYTDLPIAVLKHFDLASLPIDRKEAFLHQIQDQLDGAVRNAVLECIDDDQVVVEIENIMLTNPNINDDELIRRLVASNPRANKIFTAKVNELYKTLTQK